MSLGDKQTYGILELLKTCHFTYELELNKHITILYRNIY